MRRPHIADRRSRTSLGTTAPVQPGPHRVQKTSPCEVIGCHPNNFAEHRHLAYSKGKTEGKPRKGRQSAQPVLPSDINLIQRTMILRMEDKFDFGAYADIFRAPGEMLAYKLFLSGQHPTNVSQRLTRPEDAHRRSNTFLSECEAYRRAGQHPYLRDHIARFADRYVIQDVTDCARSVAHHYMLDHCYAMEYIKGAARKIGEYPKGSRPENIQKALNSFYEAGICYLEDASVFFPDDPHNFIFIDFAIQEFEAFW